VWGEETDEWLDGDWSHEGKENRRIVAELTAQLGGDATLGKTRAEKIPLDVSGEDIIQ